MKTVAVIFAVAIISGCHGYIVPQDEGKTSWETTLDQFRDYATDLNSMANDVIKNIRRSQLSRELDTLIVDVMSELHMYKDDMGTKLVPYTQETIERLGKDMGLLGGKISAHMAQVSESTAQYAQELETTVMQNINDVSNRVNMYTRKVAKRLSKDTKEIHNKVTSYFEEFQSRTSQNMDSVKDRIEPYLNHVRERAEEKVTSLNQLLKTHTEEVREKLQIQAEGIRDQLANTFEHVHTTLEVKQEELRNWFSPYATMIHKQVETVMDIM